MKILFHDVDGCLNAPDGRRLANKNIELSEMEAEALLELGAAVDASPVDLMVLNTGRSVDASMPIAEAIGCDKLRYVLGEHGAAGFDRDLDRELDLVAMAQASENEGLVSTYETLNAVIELMGWYNSDGYRRLNDRIGREVEILPKHANLTFVTPDGVTQAFIFAQIKALLRDDSPFDPEMFVLHDSGSDGFVDVMGAIDKGHGVRLLSEYNGISAAHTFGVGNGLNDLPMLQQVNTPICPANSEAEVKQLCRDRAGHVSDHSFIDATLNWIAAGAE